MYGRWRREKLQHLDFTLTCCIAEWVLPLRRYNHTDLSVALDLSAVSESDWEKALMLDCRAGWKITTCYLFLFHSSLAQNTFLKVSFLFSKDAYALSVIKVRQLTVLSQHPNWSPAMATWLKGLALAEWLAHMPWPGSLRFQSRRVPSFLAPFLAWSAGPKSH